MARSERAFSLSNKLGLGALILALGSVLACAIGIIGLSQSSARLQDGLNADQRLEGYSALSSQISSLALVSYEPVGVDDISSARDSRIAGLVATIEGTFTFIGLNLEEEVDRAQTLGLNEQSRRATRSLNLARMEATFDALVRNLNNPSATPDKIATDLTVFSSQFQPLLASAIQEEQRIKDRAYKQIADIRLWLTRAAVAVTALTLLTLVWFYFGLIRPQFARLDRLSVAARAIASENFDQRLPETSRDEIGELFVEVNKMADQLGKDRAQLNDTIASQTEALRHANDKLTSIDKNRRRFFADISHEMRTPLTVILMEAELAQKETPSAETFPAIISRARMLSRRIDDLLRISKSESGILSIERQPFDLTLAASEAVEEQKRRADRLGFKVQLEHSTPAMVTGDINWIRQVISGLIDNALRHSGSKGRIALVIETSSDAQTIHIIDDGVGISEAEQASVFSRFERGAESKTVGFGIGLGLAAWVVEDHGGAISLASPPPASRAIIKGKGTMITLSFPIKGA